MQTGTTAVMTAETYDFFDAEIADTIHVPPQKAASDFKQRGFTEQKVTDFEAVDSGDNAYEQELLQPMRENQQNDLRKLWGKGAGKGKKGGAKTSGNVQLHGKGLADTTNLLRSESGTYNSEPANWASVLRHKPVTARK